MSAGSTPPEPVDLAALAALAQREQAAGRLGEAEAAYRQIVTHWPDIAAAHFNLAVVLKGQNQFDAAVAHYRQAIALLPGFVEAHCNLGNLLRQLGRFDEAIAQLRQANVLRPDYAEAYNNLGIILALQGQLDEAVANYQRAIALRPGLADAHNNLGNALKQLGQLADARTCFEQALALRPGYAEAHNNLGILLFDQGLLDDAAVHYQLAINNRPNFADAHYNLASLLKQQGQLDEAVAHFEQAIAARPDHAEALKNLALTLREQLKLAEARQTFERLLSLAPDSPDAHLGLATCDLLAGDYRRGWPAYEARLHLVPVVAPAGVPRWNGEPLSGRSLLLLAEQGFGDVFHFVRYARLFKERGARVVLAAPAALIPLLKSAAGVDEVLPLGAAEDLPRLDYYLPLLSAPLAFGTDAASIPAEIPYLTADVRLVAQWRAELAALQGFKIGIAWQGSRDFSSDRWRSMPLADLAPLASVAGVRLISLQKGAGSEQIAAVDFPVHDLGERLDAAGPFLDTAAVIQNLDLVIAPDTAIAHLAGALGARTWLALQTSPNWRWLLERDDSPWYPSLRLFRQPAFADWPGVFSRIAAALRELVAYPH